MGCGVGLGDFTRLVPNNDPSSEAELGRDWPLWRDGQSRLEGGLRRMCGLLMMDPCKRENSQVAAERREEEREKVRVYPLRVQISKGLNGTFRKILSRVKVRHNQGRGRFE